jgi:pyruvate dehydrogenase E2 component (dihydrolipoamide acetyltransferase)
MAEILMPQLGETVTEGTITKWFKQVGDTVVADEVLYEVSTDKVDSEVPAPSAGVLQEIRVPEGETVPVGTVLAVIGAANGAPASAPAADAAPAAAPPAAEPAPAEPAAAEPAAADAQAPPAAAPAEAPQAEPAAAPAAAAAAPAPTEDDGEDARDGAGTTGDGRVLSPIVRRLVNDHNLDVSKIEGTGAGGRITRSDVQRAIESGAAVGAPATAPSPAPAAPAPAAPAPAAPAPAARAPQPAAPATPAGRAPAATAAPVLVGGRGDQRVPLNRIRRLTGEHMVMSKSTSPHVLTAMEVDFEAVDRVRRAVRDQWKAEEGFSLTYLPFISRAVSDAIRAFPYLNASVDGAELVIHGEVNLGVAVDLAFEGLVAPVVRQADGKRLRAIAREISDLAKRARSKQLRPDDITGGTFTLTNPGQYGTMMQFPIINQPQVAILSTDGVKRKPWVVTDAQGGESIAIRPIGVLALAWDHRAFDGAYAAAFLERVREIIETRDWAPEVL